VYMAPTVCCNIHSSPLQHKRRRNIMHLPQPHSPSTIDAALLELVVTALSVCSLIHSTSERLYRAPLSALCSSGAVATQVVSL
jgi:hypothetical protein